MITLSDRLKVIASLVDKGKNVADIGCDHGYLSAYLVANNIASKAYLTDISAKSLEKARKLFNKNNIQHKAEFVCCDGFQGLDCDIETAIIAGMGAQEIINIISGNNNNIDNFILQPMKNTDILRKFIIDNDYKIIYDKCLLQDGKFYDIIKATKGKDCLNEWEVLFGRDNLLSVSDDFIKYLHRQRRILTKILNNMKNNWEKTNYIKDYINKIDYLLSLQQS